MSKKQSSKDHTRPVVPVQNNRPYSVFSFPYTHENRCRIRFIQGQQRSGEQSLWVWKRLSSSIKEFVFTNFIFIFLSLPGKHHVISNISIWKIIRSFWMSICKREKNEKKDNKGNVEKKNYWKQKLINFQNGFFFVNDHLVINMKP